MFTKVRSQCTPNANTYTNLSALLQKIYFYFPAFFISLLVVCLLDFLFLRCFIFHDYFSFFLLFLFEGFAFTLHATGVCRCEFFLDAFTQRRYYEHFIHIINSCSTELTMHKQRISNWKRKRHVTIKNALCLYSVQCAHIRALKTYRKRRLKGGFFSFVAF